MTPSRALACLAVLGASTLVPEAADAQLPAWSTNAPSSLVTSVTPLAQTRARGRTFTVERSYGHEHVTDVPPPLAPIDAHDPWSGETVVPLVRTWAPIDAIDPWSGAPITVAPSTYLPADATDPWR